MALRTTPRMAHEDEDEDKDDKKEDGCGEVGRVQQVWELKVQSYGEARNHHPDICCPLVQLYFLPMARCNEEESRNAMRLLNVSERLAASGGRERGGGSTRGAGTNKNAFHRQGKGCRGAGETFITKKLKNFIHIGLAVIGDSRCRSNLNSGGGVVDHRGRRGWECQEGAVTSEGPSQCTSHGTPPANVRSPLRSKQGS
eukprot:508124-Hanusia_phi.AAC.1